jgi:hypothetical protein
MKYVIINASGEYLGPNGRWTPLAKYAVAFTPEESVLVLRLIPGTAAWMVVTETRELMAA